MSKIEVELWETERRKVKIEVELPIYRKQDTGGDDYSAVTYTRINEDLSAIHIGKTVRYGWSRRGFDELEYEVEFEARYRFDQSGADYHLGLGEYKSSREEFEAIRAELLDRLASA